MESKDGGETLWLHSSGTGAALGVFHHALAPDERYPSSAPIESVR